MNEKQSTGIFSYNVLRCTSPSSIPKNDFEEASCFQYRCSAVPQKRPKTKIIFQYKKLTKDRSDYAVLITKGKLHVLLMLKMARLGVLDLF